VGEKIKMRVLPAWCEWVGRPAVTVTDVRKLHCVSEKKIVKCNMPVQCTSWRYLTAGWS